MSIETATAIASIVREHGGRALVVGGWVRDRLLGRPGKDVDLEVYGLPAPRLKPLLDSLGPVNTVGESFTVYKVLDVDVSLPRRESKIGRGHRAFEVSGDPDMAPEDAARRRDFTVNAIAWDPLTDAYLDPFDGRRDLLERRLLRAVDPRTFGDDSLRVLRGIQFAARFDLQMDPGTKEICRRIPLDDLPAERIWGEMEKLLLLANRPSAGFALALDLGVIDRLFPELKALVGCPQEPEWHPEGDVWVHTLLVIDEARRRIDDLDRPRQLTVMLGAVCHDLGKPPTTAFVDGRIRSIDHEQAGVAPTAALLGRLNVQTIAGYDVARQVDWHRRAPSEAARLLQVGDAGGRRRLPAAGGEGGPRAARAGRDVGLPREDGHVRLLGHRPLSRARARARRRASPAGANRQGPASIGARRRTGPAHGNDPPAPVRTATGWARANTRRGTGARQDHRR